MNIYAATITLVLVMDPLGNIPMFLSVLNSVDVKRRKLITLRETFIAFVILLLFLFFWEIYPCEYEYFRPGIEYCWRNYFILNCNTHDFSP